VADVSLHEVTKKYSGAPAAAVSSLDLEIGSGEFLVLVGPSGCGKSTVLRLVAGLEEVSGGEVRIGGKCVNGVSPAERNVAMVFQSYALYPHMTVLQNMELPLKIRGVAKETRRAKVSDVAEILGLTEELRKRPGRLSGGQRQRVAMGRAMVREPSVFLLDEPLSNLDAKLRVQMRAEIAELQRRLGTTMIFVTHDQVEAMSMADRVAVLDNGVLQQVGAPQTVYDAPANIFVAGFMGSPTMNMIGGEVVDLGSETVGFRSAVNGTILKFDKAVSVGRSLRQLVGRKVTAGIRPEHLRMGANEHGNVLRARVALVESLGNETIVRVALEHLSPAVGHEDWDSTMRLQRPNDEATIVSDQFTLRTSERVSCRGGDSVGIEVETKHVHLFDAGSGLALGEPSP
jgi:multiple sugar transport system ATP-binding protein